MEKLEAKIIYKHMAPKKENNDFDAPSLVTLGRHGEDIADIKKRITDLENKFGSNEKIADTLCVTAEKAVKMKEMFNKNFLDLLEKDTKIKMAITNLVNDADRSYTRSKLKQFGSTIGFAIIYLLGLITSAIVNKYIK